MTSNLITSLSKLDAPDREVDAEIDVIFFGGETVWKQANYTMEQFPASKRASKNHIGGYAYEYVPAYTASVDAAIALAERVLPGWTFEHIGQDYIRARGLENDVMPMGWTVEISDGSQTIQGQAPTFPLAICIALLRAKEASKL